MRKIVITLLALSLLSASAAFASNVVRISQAYGGGGSSTGVYKYDYIELFNSSGNSVNVAGWSIQYGSSTSTSGFGNGCTTAYCNLAVLPTGATIPACGYYLVQVGTAASGATGNDLPTPDGIYPLGPNMGAGGGKLALLTVSTYPTACPGGGPIGGNFVDAVAWGSTSTCAETTPVGGTHTAATVDIRNGGGMNDTDVNSADFTLTSGTVAAPWAVRNSASAPNPGCTIVPTLPTTWGKIKTIYR
jgi:hypothetical protein